MGIKRGPTLVRDGLVLHLDAANPRSYPGSGTTWFDLSGNNNHATLSNSPVYVSGNRAGFVHDLTNDYIYTDITVTTTTFFTMEVWFSGNPGTSSYPALLSAWNTSTGGAGGWELQHSNGNLGLHPTYTVGYTANIPNLATYVQSGTAATIYLNGILAQTQTLTTDLRTGRIGIGNLQAEGFTGYYYNGTFHSVKGYNRALTSDEILQNYTAQKSRFGL